MGPSKMSGIPSSRFRVQQTHNNYTNTFGNEIEQNFKLDLPGSLVEAFQPPRQLVTTKIVLFVLALLRMVVQMSEICNKGNREPELLSSL